MTAMQNIQLTNINEELVRLWDTEQGQKKIKASLFTLILYVQKTERAGFYQTLIKSVVSKFPCRVIMILNGADSSEEYLKTSVSSETVGEGELQIFCELIQIEVAGKLIERVPFIILPHIIPDLPMYLLWTQDPSKENTVLPPLEPLAHRIIFDSETTSDLQKYCKTVLSLMGRFHCGIGDLNWSALSGWRNIFVHVFNDINAIQLLAECDCLRIQYNKSESQFQKHTEIEAAYLQAWLASRLRWTFVSAKTDKEIIRLNYQKARKDIVVELAAQEIEGQPPGALLAIEIECAKNKAHYVFKKHPQSRQVFIQYSEKDFCQLPYTAYLGDRPEGQEIIEEIFYPSGGTHYRDMLKTLAEISWSFK